MSSQCQNGVQCRKARKRNYIWGMNYVAWNTRRHSLFSVGGIVIVLIEGLEGGREMVKHRVEEDKRNQSWDLGRCRGTQKVEGEEGKFFGFYVEKVKQNEKWKPIIVGGWGWGGATKEDEFSYNIFDRIKKRNLRNRVHRNRIAWDCRLNILDLDFLLSCTKK